MTAVNAGSKVRRGYYFGKESWKLVPIAKDGDPLPGEARESYVRLPAPAVLVLAPVMGGAFVLFLPFLGFYLVGGAALRRVARVFAGSATEIAATVHPGWKPGEAHLTGRRAEGEAAPGEPAPKGEEELDEVEREIAEKRRGR